MVTSASGASRSCSQKKLPLIQVYNLSLQTSLSLFLFRFSTTSLSAHKILAKTKTKGEGRDGFSETKRVAEEIRATQKNST